METAKTIIIGAGPTGLSAAYHLDTPAVIIEQHATIGGWCRSIEENGFTFDYAGHIMFSNDPYVHEMYAQLLGDNVHWQNREAWVYSHNVYTRYPFQGSLYGLPAEVIAECLMGAITARYGDDESSTSNGHANGHASGNGHAPAGLNGKNGQSNARGEDFEHFIYRVWGSGIAKHFAIPYNKKIWAVPLSEMETSWLGGRVPMPDLNQMIMGALTPSTAPMGPNARFGYPLRGGFQALMEGFLPHLHGDIKLSTRVTAVAPEQRTVTLDDGTVQSYDVLVSTMPLPQLVRCIGRAAPPEIHAAAAALRHTSVRCVNLGIGREQVTEKHWIYYPEDTIFHRIFVQGNASPHCNPPGGFGITCEITYGPDKPLPVEGDELIQRCIDDCIRVGLITADDAIWAANEVDMPYAYVVYDHTRKQSVDTIRNWLAEHQIVLAGRYSEWEYYNSDHAFLAGRKAAQTVKLYQQSKPALERSVVA